MLLVAGGGEPGWRGMCGGVRGAKDPGPPGLGRGLGGNQGGGWVGRGQSLKILMFSKSTKKTKTK